MADFPEDTLRANRIVLQGRDVSLGLDGSNMQTLSALPPPTILYFQKMVFVIGDRAYICTSNLEAPVNNEDVFWVEV